MALAKMALSTVGKMAPHYAGHAKGNHGDPRRAVEFLDLQTPWNQRPQCLRVDRPVREEEISPGLTPGPRCFRERPGPMIDVGERGMHRFGLLAVGRGRREVTLPPKDG